MVPHLAVQHLQLGLLPFYKQCSERLCSHHVCGAIEQQKKTLTNGLDDSLLQLPLLMSFDDLGTYVGAAIIGTSQLIVDTQSKLTQQGVEHLQYCGTCVHKQ